MSGEQGSEAPKGALVPPIPGDDLLPEELAAAGSVEAWGGAAAPAGTEQVSSTAGQVPNRADLGRGGEVKVSSASCDDRLRLCGP